MFLFDRFSLPHFDANASEVHLIFDAPNLHPFNQKVFEHNRRDQGHTDHAFTPLTATPSAWRTILGCRQCKRSLIEAIGLSYMQSAKFKLRSGQTLILSGCFSGTASTVCISANSLPTPDSQYTSNAEEADMRIWRHVTQCSCNRIHQIHIHIKASYCTGERSTIKYLLIYSPRQSGESFTP